MQTVTNLCRKNFKVLPQDKMDCLSHTLDQLIRFAVCSLNFLLEVTKLCNAHGIASTTLRKLKL